MVLDQLLRLLGHVLTRWQRTGTGGKNPAVRRGDGRDRRRRGLAGRGRLPAAVESGGATASTCSPKPASSSPTPPTGQVPRASPSGCSSTWAQPVTMVIALVMAVRRWACRSATRGRGGGVVVGLAGALRSLPTLGLLTLFTLLMGLGLMPPIPGARAAGHPAHPVPAPAGSPRCPPRSWTPRAPWA
ncbi:hypothetical protein QJS66_14755 [Kocuria rhizophila]|nr:hypothetical protein QJS66_14755 [Kocuria rhizophila]